jgi:hypothetical protein
MGVTARTDLASFDGHLPARGIAIPLFWVADRVTERQLVQVLRKYERNQLLI